MTNAPAKQLAEALNNIKCKGSNIPYKLKVTPKLCVPSKTSVCL